MCLNCLKMTLDLKIEIFAHTLFYNTWTNMGIVKTKPEILQIFGEECCKVENYMEASDLLFAIPVICRRKMFGKIYLKDFTKEKLFSLKSLSDCYDYIISTCDRDDLFGHLTIFERMFATCCFVIEFCIRIISWYNIVDVVKYGHLFWSMYFDKFTEEFYEEGGWDELKEVARPYSKNHHIFLFFDENDMTLLGKTIDDYYDFMDNDQYNEYKYKLKKIHVSKLWIKYRIERFESCIENPNTYQYHADASDMDEVLENLKGLLDYISKENLILDMACSETSDEYDAYLDNLNAHGVLPTNQMDESFCNRMSSPYSIPDTTNFCAEKGGVKGTVEEETRAEKTLEVNCSSKNNEEQKKIAMRTEIVSTSQMANSELDGNSFSCIPTRQVIDNLYSGNTEMQSATPNETEALSTNQKDISLCYRKSPPHSVPNIKNISSEKGVKGSVEEVSTKKTLGIHCTSKNGDDQKEIPMRTEIMSTSQTAETESNGKTSPDILPTRQLLDRYPDNLSSKNPVRECETPTESEALSTNQPPPSSDMDTLNRSFEEIRFENTSEVNSLKNGYQQIEIAKRTEIVPTSHMAKSELDGNSQHIPIQDCTDKLYSGNTKRQSETPYTPEDSSKNQIDASLCHREPPSNVIPDTMNFSSEKEGSAEEDRIENNFEDNSITKNGHDQWEIAKRMENISISQMAKSELDAKTTLDIPPILKVFNPENRFENTNYEMEEIKKAREDLRNEQNNHDIRIFLRMILVLSDRQGTKCVLQALQNSEDGPEKTQVTRKKQKKKHKKNKSKM